MCVFTADFASFVDHRHGAPFFSCPRHIAFEARQAPEKLDVTLDSKFGI